ncbi:MAG: glycoside hydrolase [unclassified Hahellaceae]|nr:glycoside hydrolase [Hahellaceae bacterium]|tara:strand:+ start:77943 stop:79199 length:1257 start_codon:yes stop_codon:yes gene_type:complete
MSILGRYGNPSAHQGRYRISIVTETFWPDVNGVSRTLQQLIQMLQQGDVEVQIICPRSRHMRSRDWDSADTFSSLRPVDILRVRGLPLPGYRDVTIGLPCRRQITECWQARRPDIVYLATEGPLCLSALQAAKSLGLRPASGFHTSFDQYAEHYRLDWLSALVMTYLRWFHNRTAITLTPTREQRARLISAGFRNVEVLSRGVDCKRFSPNLRCYALRSAWGVPVDGLVVLYVGRLASEKNLPLVIRAFKAIRQQQPNARLVFVGDGPLRKTIRTQLPDAVLSGLQHGEALARHYASADIFLFPSQTDTFGNVVTEAMASGLPVVAFNTAAAAEHLCHNFSGMCATLADETGYIRNAVELARDAAQRLRLGSAARVCAEGLGWEAIASRFLEYLKQPSNRGAVAAPFVLNNHGKPLDA